MSTAIERFLPFAAIAETILTKGKSPGTTAISQLDRLDRLKRDEAERQETAIDRELQRQFTKAQIDKLRSPEKEDKLGVLKQERIRKFIESENEARKSQGKDPLSEIDMADIEIDYEGYLKRSDEQKSKTRNVEKDLRNEFDDLSKDFRKSRDAHLRLESVAKKDSAPADLAMIFNYMKILDPGSVVRESEFRTAEQAKGWLGDMDSNGQGSRVPNLVRTAIQKATTGQKLLPEQKEQFLDAARSIMDSQVRNQQRNIQRFTEIAKREGANPANIVTPISSELEKLLKQLGASTTTPTASNNASLVDSVLGGP